MAGCGGWGSRSLPGCGGAGALKAHQPGLHIAIGKVGLQIGIGLQVSVAAEHLLGQPVAAVGTQLGQGIATLLRRPILEPPIGPLRKEALAALHLAQQQVVAGQGGLDGPLTAGLQQLAGGLDALGLALGKSGGGQGSAGQQGGLGGLGGPAAEQIHLLLHGEEGADLIEEGAKLRGRQVGIRLSLQPAALLHQLLEQLQAQLAFGPGRQVAAEQVEHSIGPQAQQLIADFLEQGRQLAHALQQLAALLEHGCRQLVAPPLMHASRSGQAGQTGQQRQIPLATAAQHRGIGGLQGPAGQLEALQGAAGFQEQQQPAGLQGVGQLQGWHQAVGAAHQSRQLGLVFGAALAIGQQVGTGPEQLGAGLESFDRVALFGRTVQALLQGIENSLGIAGPADAQQPEVVDRQFQPRGA